MAFNWIILMRTVNRSIGLRKREENFIYSEGHEDKGVGRFYISQL
jgi:hypothetical protein